MPVIRWSDVVEFLPELLGGARWTIALTLVIMSVSMVAALLVALARLSRFPALRIPMAAYVEFIRSTPALEQLYYIFYVMPFFGVTFPAVIAGIVGMSINYTAYLSEVYRAAVSAVPRTQVEAAESLGLSYWQSRRLVILPQAARVALPPTVNYLLGLFKDTSLLSLITIKELMFAGILFGATTFKYFTILTEVAIIYFIICYPVALLSTWLGRRMKMEAEDSTGKKAGPGWLSLAEAGLTVAGDRGVPPADGPVVRVRGVHKWFGHLHVLRGVTIDIARGEVVVVIGPSGSGKTTFLRCLNRLEHVSSGEIEFKGRPVERRVCGEPPFELAGEALRRLRTEIGIVFQQYNLFPHLSAIENVALAPI